MKKFGIKLASLLLFFATGAMIGMEVGPKIIIRNIAWGYAPSWKGWDWYQIKVSSNLSSNWIPEKGLEEGSLLVLGNLNDINQIQIRRSGWGSSLTSVSVSTITAEELDEIKQEAQDNQGKDVVLAIGATTTGFDLSTHYWQKAAVQGSNKGEELLPEYVQVIVSFLQNAKSKSISEDTQNKISFILKKDTTKDSRFKKELAQYMQSHTAGKLSLGDFTNSVKKLQLDLSRLKTLPRKPIK